MSDDTPDRCRRQGSATQHIGDGKPLFILGGPNEVSVQRVKLYR